MEDLDEMVEDFVLHAHCILFLFYIFQSGVEVFVIEVLEFLVSNDSILVFIHLLKQLQHLFPLQTYVKVLRQRALYVFQCQKAYALV